MGLPLGKSGLAKAFASVNWPKRGGPKNVSQALGRKNKQRRNVAAQQLRKARMQLYGMGYNAQRTGRLWQDRVRGLARMNVLTNPWKYASGRANRQKKNRG